jgi:hypothetical protein
LGEGEPKYLNSPDTPLFDKGRTLYNLDKCSPASRQTGRVIVVEGYMDVIAIAQAGFGDAVAPLGTALTEQQIQMLWRMTEKPLLCFDGDAAGQKAALRAALRALPLLKPGNSSHCPRGKIQTIWSRSPAQRRWRRCWRPLSRLWNAYGAPKSLLGRWVLPKTVRASNSALARIWRISLMLKSAAIMPMRFESASTRCLQLNLALRSYPAQKARNATGANRKSCHRVPKPRASTPKIRTF